ncbi:RNA-directed RNA polymerase [Aphelenchoides fujianensis]|nr:RNA-directed RNA polymerase [Aphelenchoides fujianensis]
MLPRALSPPPPRRPFSTAVGGNAEESEDENESIADPEEWLRTQMREMRDFATGPLEFAAQPPRRRQRDILAVNTFDRKPIEERLEIPYEVVFRLICDVGDQKAATERIEQLLEIMGLSEAAVQPLINQAPASFDKPQLSRRGSGFLVGTLRQVPPLFVAMIKRMMAANSKIPVQLEVMNIYELLNPNEPIKYYDGWMDCTSFGFGSMPSNALFLERMAYRAFENGPSNVDLIENSLMSANNVADGRVLASWMDFQFSRRLLHLTFAVPINPQENEGLRYAGYRLTIQFSMIREIVAVFHATEDENRILIRFKSPPNLWRAQPKRMNGKMSLNLIACRDWVRVLHYETADGTGLSREVLGMSSVLSIGLPRTQAYPSDAEPYEVFHREEDGNFLKSGCLSRYFNLLGRLQTALKCPLFFSAVRFLHLGSELSPVVCPDFDSHRLNYAVQGLLERGFVVLDQLITGAAEDPNNPPFFQRIRAAFKENAEACEEAMEDLLSICDERRLTTLLRSFDVLFRQKVGGSSVEQSFSRLNELPKNSVLVKKVIVTPLRRLFFPPQVMMCNRIVRKFGEQFALRCIFRDENGQRLSSRNFVRGRFTNLPFPVAEEIMAKTVRRTLLQPLVVGGLQFRFLAWSNSQLRDHGCYMYADHYARDEAGNLQFVNVDTIRDWMGDFSALRPRDWCVIPDFESDFLDPGNGKNYVFSDGVGRISERFADRIAAMMELQPTPSCFQVRFKGFKGIVVVWPNLLANPFYPDVVFRESQKNFPKKTAAVQAGANTTSGIVDFFLKYLDQDAIGRVSNAHLIAADKRGIYHPVCESIAAKCSIAVDFPKTGEPADPLTDLERFNDTPDFMTVGHRSSYRSKRLLGKLFRKARVLEQMLEVVSSESEVETKADVFLLDEELETAEAAMFAQAITVRDLYYAKLQQILDEYGIESEAEALSGHASFIRRISDMEKSDYSFYHADRLVEMRMTKIREKFREEFFDECGGESAVFQPAPGGQLTFVGPDRLLAKARCWYTVAYGRPADDKLLRFRSFPWLVWDVLLVARTETSGFSEV